MSAPYYPSRPRSSYSSRSRSSSSSRSWSSYPSTSFCPIGTHFSFQAGYRMIYGQEVGFGPTGRYDPRNGNTGSFVVTDVRWTEVGYFYQLSFTNTSVGQSPLWYEPYQPQRSPIPVQIRLPSQVYEDRTITFNFFIG